MKLRDRRTSFGCAFSAHIRNFHIICTSGKLSAFLLGLLVFAILLPLYNVEGMEDTSAVAGTFQDSTLTFTSIRSTASVDLNVTSTDGTFSSSTDGTAGTSDTRAAFSISTNNYTGYNLSIGYSSDNATLTDSVSGGTLSSISSTLSEADFSTYSTNNVWGYKPSYYGSLANNMYYPIPVSASAELRSTSAANSADGISNPDTYTVSLGAKVDYDLDNGTYSSNNTFVLTYVANPAVYQISYNKGNTTDTVSNLPSMQSGSASASSVVLSSTVPTRVGYNFIGWCLGAISTNTTTKVDTCVDDTTNNITAKTFTAGGDFGVDRTITNAVTLRAMWSVRSYTLTVQNGGNTEVSGSGTYKYGEVVTITATPVADTGCYTYNTPSWSKTSGEGVLNSASGTSVTFTMGAGDAVVSATSAPVALTQTITLVRTGGASAIVIDGVSKTGSSVTLSCGSHTISGTYSNNYAFSSWAGTDGVSVASAYSSSTTMTVNGAGTLTLNGKGCSTVISGTLQDFTPCSSIANGQTGTLTDRRDGQSYTVGKLYDGRWWILDNLALGAAELTEVISSTNTNIPSDHTFSLPTPITSGFNSYDTAQINAAYSDIELQYGSGSSAGKGKVGVYYNYCAATAGTYCMAQGEGAGDATSDVCPRGWRLPTGGIGNNYEFYKLSKSYGSGLTTSAHMIGSGYFSGGWRENNGQAYYWSSSYYNADRMHITYMYSSSLEHSSVWLRTTGGSIRCILSN